MKNRLIPALLFALFSFAFFAGSASAQPVPGVKRTIYKSDKFDFGSGGTIVVVGAPTGSVRVEGWSENVVQVDATIEIAADSEADLDLLSKVTGFVLQETLGRTVITSVGTHDKTFIKKTIKKFPKHLMGIPFRIDYVVKVPRYSDLQIDGGKGSLFVGGVDGTIRINYLDADAKLELLGGGIFATIGGGSVDVSIPSRSWRGRFADVQLGSGTMNVSLPPSLNADVDANILRTGSIDNKYAALKPKQRRAEFTERSIAARSGTGGVPLKFTVGDGNMSIFQTAQP